PGGSISSTGMSSATVASSTSASGPASSLRVGRTRSVSTSIRRLSNGFMPGIAGHKFYLFQGFTFWDVLEHIEEPERYFERMPDSAFAFLSVPIFGDLTAIRASKHYRPGEHLYYFTEEGLARWMAMHGFRLLERDDFETRAGRDNILSFAFRRD